MKKSKNSENVVDLCALRMVASGKKRDVYLVPPSTGSLNAGPNTLVLKVPRYKERLDRLDPAKRLLSKALPASELRNISSEVAYVKKLEKNFDGDLSAIPIPCFRGYVHTNAGLGALWDAVCDQHGNLAPTLKDLTQKELTACVPALNKFVEACFKFRIVASDLHAGNLVFAHIDGKQCLMIIDGFGDHRLISIRALWNQYNRRSLLERFQKTSKQTGLKFDPDERLFRAKL